jgi:transposase-like protein
LSWRRQSALVHTDADDVYGRLENWDYGHKMVWHARGEYAWDDDGDGFCEVHVNTMEGVWSLLRSWLRPHRGVSQEKLPLYLAFFQVVHNAPAERPSSPRSSGRSSREPRSQHPGSREEPCKIRTLTFTKYVVSRGENGRSSGEKCISR